MVSSSAPTQLAPAQLVELLSWAGVIVVEMMCFEADIWCSGLLVELDLNRFRSRGTARQRLSMRLTRNPGAAVDSSWCILRQYLYLPSPNGSKVKESKLLESSQYEPSYR